MRKAGRLAPRPRRLPCLVPVLVEDDEGRHGKRSWTGVAAR